MTYKKVEDALQLLKFVNSQIKQISSALNQAEEAGASYYQQAVKYRDFIITKMNTHHVQNKTIEKEKSLPGVHLTNGYNNLLENNLKKFESRKVYVSPKLYNTALRYNIYNEVRTEDLVVDTTAHTASNRK